MYIDGDYHTSHNITEKHSKLNLGTWNVYNFKLLKKVFIRALFSYYGLDLEKPQICFTVEKKDRTRLAFTLICGQTEPDKRY